MLAYINISVVCLSCFIAFLFLFVKDNEKIINIIKFYFWWMMILEIVSFMLAKNKVSNHHLLNYYTFIEITSCSFFFYHFLKRKLKRPKEAKIIQLVSTVTIVIQLINSLFFKRIELSMTLMSIPIILYCFISFYLMMDVEIENAIVKMFIVSLFLMHSSSLLIFSSMEVIFTFESSRQFNIFLIRSLVFLMAKIIVFLPLLIYLFNQIQRTQYE